MEKLVTVATFDFPVDAEARRLLLEQEGIQAFLADDNVVGMDWFLSNATGGAKLQVAASDVDRASEILERYHASKTKACEESPEEDVTFACQDCGKRITFSGARRGCVETCPECGNYVDVPDETEQSLSAEPETASQAIHGVVESKQPQGSDSGSRTSTQLWIEVFAVLCLAYIPYLFSALSAINGGGATSHSFANEMLYRIVNAIQISMPLLVIVTLAKDPWSLFGIVRPKWIVDALVGCGICVWPMVFRDFVVSLLPPSMLERSAYLHVTHRVGPEGILAYCLLLVACVASGFAQELVFRGYLIVRLERLLCSTWVPVLITTVMYASYHVYQGATPVIGAAASGVFYAVTFCWLRRLWPLCVAHAMHNFMTYL